MDKTKTRDVTIRVFAVLIAFILWMYVSSEDNPEMQLEISGIPVKLVNLETLQQQSLIMTGDPNAFTIKLTVKGRSSDVRMIRPQDFVAEANVGVGARFKGDNHLLVEIKERPAGIEIPNQPAYITVEFDELVEKNFPIVLNVQGAPKEGYAKLAQSIKPAQVILKGAAKYIGRVNSVAAKIDIKDSVEDINTSLPLQVLDKEGKVVGDVECNPKTVDISIPINQAKTVPITIKTVGKLPDGVFMLDTMVDPVSINITGDENVVNSIRTIETSPINLDDINTSITKTVKLNIPEGAVNIDNVQNVNVIITVEKTISKTFNVLVDYINLPGGLTSDLLTNTIGVTLSGKESVINQVIAANITATVDLTDAPAEDGEYEYTPKLSFPEGLEIKEIDPPKIKVKITKKQG